MYSHLPEITLLSLARLYMIALVLTLMLETIFLLAFESYRNRISVIAVGLVNVITRSWLELALVVYFMILGLGYPGELLHPYVFIFFVELLIILLEWILFIYLFKNKTKKELFFLSLGLNIASFTGGLLLFGLIL